MALILTVAWSATMLPMRTRPRPAMVALVGVAASAAVIVALVGGTAPGPDLGDPVVIPGTVTSPPDAGDERSSPTGSSSSVAPRTSAPSATPRPRTVPSAVPPGSSTGTPDRGVDDDSSRSMDPPGSAEDDEQGAEPPAAGDDDGTEEDDDDQRSLAPRSAPGPGGTDDQAGPRQPREQDDSAEDTGPDDDTADGDDDSDDGSDIDDGEE